MEEQILRLAENLTGAEGAELEVLATLCAVEDTLWCDRLRPDLTPEDCGEAFLCAVAFCAAADFYAIQSVEDVESFTAGEISIKRRSGDNGGKATAMRQTAERLMAPYAAAGGFAFKGVRE